MRKYFVTNLLIVNFLVQFISRICLGLMKGLTFRLSNRVASLLEAHFGRGMVAFFEGSDSSNEIDADQTFSNMARHLATGRGFPRAGRDSQSVIKSLLRVMSIVDSDLRTVTTRTHNVMEVTAGTALCLDLVGQVYSVILALLSFTFLL